MSELAKVKRGYITVADKTYHYDSSYEHNYILYLQHLVDNGEIVGFIKNTTRFVFTKKIEFRFGNSTRCVESFIPDFIIFLAGNRYEIHEIKGWQDDRFYSQLHQFEKDYPGILVKVIDRTDMRKFSKKSISPLMMEIH